MQYSAFILKGVQQRFLYEWRKEIKEEEKMRRREDKREDGGREREKKACPRTVPLASDPSA